MSELTISVSQLNNYIKNIFDNEETLIGIKVVGEITNLKPSSRAIYFDLKDENAAIPCVVFDESIISSFSFGDKVSAKGKLNFYVKGGKLTFVVSKMEKYGIGDLYKQYLELKDKLQKDAIAADADTSLANEDLGAVLGSSTKRKDAEDALTVLGYSRSEASSVLRGIDTEALELDEIIRLALKKLMR